MISIPSDIDRQWYFAKANGRVERIFDNSLANPRVDKRLFKNMKRLYDVIEDLSMMLIGIQKDRHKVYCQ